MEKQEFQKIEAWNSLSSKHISTLKDRIIDVINQNTLPNDFGTVNLNVKDIEHIADEIVNLYIFKDQK